MTYCYINQGYNSLLLAITFLYIIKSPAAGYSKMRVCGFNLSDKQYIQQECLKMGVSSLCHVAVFFLVTQSSNGCVRD